MTSWTADFFRSASRFMTISITGHVVQTATIFLLAATLTSGDFGNILGHCGVILGLLWGHFGHIDVDGHV